jgi:predicted  nucleic acid-binding Zn-ribbon protein
LEREIREIIALDPANFSIKSDIFYNQAKNLDDYKINERMQKIDEEVKNVVQSKKRIEKELQALEQEKENLRNRFEELGQWLYRLEIMDPANVKVKTQNLYRELGGLSRIELENIKTTGELENFFKERLLLRFQIEETDGKIKNLNKELVSVKLAENTLLLEKLILQLEKLDRHVKSEEPRLLQINDEIQRLEIKRNKIKRSLSSN